MGEANAPRKMAQPKQDKWICLLKMSEVKMREMPKSAANLNRGTSNRERERKYGKNGRQAAKGSCEKGTICCQMPFVNVFKMSFVSIRCFFFSSCKLMNLTNSSTGPASAFTTAENMMTTTAHTQYSPYAVELQLHSG